MHSIFNIKKIRPENAFSVIKDIGFDSSYVHKAVNKYNFILLKIFDLTPPQSTIVKQIALSVGADAAVHREVITCKVEKSSLLLGCTLSQLDLIADKLRYQPFKLYVLADLLLQQKNIKLKPLIINDISFNWSEKTYIMGILNITPDSFSDGGSFLNKEDYEKQIIKMIESKVDIIDIGGETTKPFSKPVPADEQLKRIIPAINIIRSMDKKIAISVDTRDSKVAQSVIDAGADIINDVSGFDFDCNMVKVVAGNKVPVVIMHSLGSPETMQLNPEYNENIVDAVYNSLYQKLEFAMDNGIPQENIILDPGIGFGKTLEHNLELIQRVEEFISLGQPLLLGVSRKSVISNITNIPASERDDATLALNSYLASKGANILRVHNFNSNINAFKVLDKVIKNNF